MLNDMDDRKRLIYLLSLSPQGYIVEYSRPGLRFMGIATLVGLMIGLILVVAYLGQ